MASWCVGPPQFGQRGARAGRAGWDRPGSRGTAPTGSIAGPADEGVPDQHTDLMADAQRLERIVGDQYGGAAGEQTVPQRSCNSSRVTASRWRERLVHQHDRPVLAQRAGECCALAHAAGQLLAGTIVEPVGSSRPRRAASERASRQQPRPAWSPRRR